MRQIFFIIIPFAFFLIVSCRKKSPEEKLEGKWEIEAAFVNGTDRTAELDTLYLSYYQFVGEDDDGWEMTPHVTIGIDFNEAHWDDSCSYINFGSWNTRGFSINEDRTELTTGASGCTISKSFIPAFIHYNEVWRIKKWKSKELWLEMDNKNNNNHYETRLKRIIE